VDKRSFYFRDLARCVSAVNVDKCPGDGDTAASNEAR